MEKKVYNKPELTVVKLTSMTLLLENSDPMEDGGGDAARRASLSTFDGEE